MEIGHGNENRTWSPHARSKLSGTRKNNGPLREIPTTGRGRHRQGLYGKTSWSFSFGHTNRRRKNIHRHALDRSTVYFRPTLKGHASGSLGGSSRRASGSGTSLVEKIQRPFSRKPTARRCGRRFLNGGEGQGEHTEFKN